jgi:hypothetical protein
MVEGQRRPPSFKDRRHSQETKDRIAQSLTGQQRSQETKDRIAQSLTGKPLPTERTDRISEGVKEWWRRRRGQQNQS